MYVKVVLTKNVYVKPEDLGPQLSHRLEYVLREAVEGTRDPVAGLIVAVVDIIDDASVQGKVLETGTVVFAMKYIAVAFRLAPSEVVDGVVTEIVNDGVYVDVGATVIRVSRYSMPRGFVFEGEGDAPRFASPDGTVVISEGSTLRVRVISESTTAIKFGAVGSIDGPYLGLKL